MFSKPLRMVTIGCLACPRGRCRERESRGGPAAVGAADTPVQSQTCWSGVAFGLALAALAAYHQYKLPPVLPVMLETYGYDRVLAGGFMSVFALAGLTLSLRVGRGLERHGLAPYLALAFGAFLGGEALALAMPENGWLMLLARGLEGVGFTVCAIAGGPAARHRFRASPPAGRSCCWSSA